MQVAKMAVLALTVALALGVSATAFSQSSYNASLTTGDLVTTCIDTNRVVGSLDLTVSGSEVTYSLRFRGAKLVGTATGLRFYEDSHSASGTYMAGNLVATDTSLNGVLEAPSELIRALGETTDPNVLVMLTTSMCPDGGAGGLLNTSSEPSKFGPNPKNPK